MCIGLKSSEFTQERSVAHLVPLPWELAVILSFIGRPTLSSDGSRSPLVVLSLPASESPQGT